MGGSPPKVVVPAPPKPTAAELRSLEIGNLVNEELIRGQGFDITGEAGSLKLTKAAQTPDEIAKEEADIARQARIDELFDEALEGPGETDEIVGSNSDLRAR